jgi:biopolymer transport protein ExbB/TolQ
MLKEFILKSGIVIYPLFFCSIFSLALTLHLSVNLYVAKKVSKILESDLSELERKLGWLSHIASLSTLTGLLGTVLGIQEAFSNLQAEGQPSLEVFSSGISQALITTIFGLSIAIPSIFLYHFFSDRLERISEKISKKLN